MQLRYQIKVFTEYNIKRYTAEISIINKLENPTAAQVEKCYKNLFNELAYKENYERHHSNIFFGIFKLDYSHLYVLTKEDMPEYKCIYVKDNNNE